MKFRSQYGGFDTSGAIQPSMLRSRGKRMVRERSLFIQLRYDALGPSRK